MDSKMKEVQIDKVFQKIFYKTSKIQKRKYKIKSKKQLNKNQKFKENPLAKKKTQKKRMNRKGA